MWRISSHGEVTLEGWSVAWTAPGAAGHPSELQVPAGAWLAAVVPGTAAGALRAAGVPGPARIDGVDWWYRCRFPSPPGVSGTRMVLCFDGLATVADGWLNGEPLLHGENMFLASQVDVTGRLRPDDNELMLRFAALEPLLGARRPRPRWRVPMLEHQQLRWFRTTLLGRTPGWSPPCPAVGPWRPVRLEMRARLDARQVQLRASLNGTRGEVSVAGALVSLDGRAISEARLIVTAPDGHEVGATLACLSGADGVVEVTGAVGIADAAPWWPHTHGDQPLYDVRLVVSQAGDEVSVGLGRIGFRTIDLSTTGGDFALSLNGVPIFCRGACWTPLDVLTLNGSADDYRRTLRAMRDAGMNMVRVAGPMVYETALFHDLCDELGILIWQDFMFANMDYPEDPAFVALVKDEVRQVLGRWQGRPSLALLCGDSEGEQQAAMWGAPAAAWHRPLFRETLPALCRELRPDVPYWPSSASGGAFPHQPSEGTTSYYGVGAYLRPMEDARRSEVRFASECLGFANVPEDAILARLTAGVVPRVHTPEWKAAAPRDRGAGWDFDDVRDFYTTLLFGADAVALRSTDHDRYLALARITSGEVMEAAFAEWRRARSPCRGALVWFLRDLVAGAGWGILDVDGGPKAAYHYLRRVLQPVAVLLSDEGLNGAYVHIVNERPQPWRGQLQVRLYRDDAQVAAIDRPVELPARGRAEFAIAALLGEFSDTTYAYRFGAPPCDLIAASLVSPGQTVESEVFLYPTGRPRTREADLGMEATVAFLDGDRFTLAVRSRRFAHAVAIATDGFVPDDDYFHVRPGGTKSVILRRIGSAAEPRGTVQASNARAATRITKAG